MAIVPGAQNKKFSFDPQESKQKNLFYVLGALVLVTAAVAYFGFSKDSSLPPLPTDYSGLEGPQGEEITNSLERIDFQKIFLDDQKFRELSLPVKLPLTIDPGEKGRANPFDSF